MGAVGGLLGVGGGAGGTGFAGPSQAQILSPATTAQANEQYKNAQGAIDQQQAFVNATQAQNGLGNQSSVYNQMQGVANGTGPNPAAAMLANATGANVANQAALMAGQRGANSNAGLIARQAAMQGANTQQQAAGQQASMQAQQSLNALSNMGGIANTQAAQQAAALQGLNQNVQGEQSNILNSIAGANQSRVGMQSNVNNANASMANTTMQGQQGMLGGIFNGAGAMMSAMADGGEVELMPLTPPSNPNSDKSKGGGAGGLLKLAALLADGGSVSPELMSLTPSANAGANQLYKGVSSFGKALMTPKKPVDEGAGASGTLTNGPGGPAATPGFAKGGSVPALVSPGEVYIPPKGVEEVAKGKKDPISAGEKIPGKAKVKGNSYANDTVHKTLEEGGIVLPKSVMESAHPHWAAHKFVSAILAKNGKMPKKSE